MTHDPAGDFDHPKIPLGSPLVRHILYGCSQPQFLTPPTAATPPMNQ
jgi:hypothetical protein